MHGVSKIVGILRDLSLSHAKKKIKKKSLLSGLHAQAFNGSAVGSNPKNASLFHREGAQICESILS